MWIRLSFANADKGRVFGRNGRTIQAIRTILNTAARGSAQQVHLEVYDSRSSAEKPGGVPAKKSIVKRR